MPHPSRGTTPSVVPSAVGFAASVNWDQNKALRDKVYENQNTRGKEMARGGGGGGNRSAPDQKSKYRFFKTFLR